MSQQVAVGVIWAVLVSKGVEVPARRQGAAVEGAGRELPQGHAKELRPLVELVGPSRLAVVEDAAGEHGGARRAAACLASRRLRLLSPHAKCKEVQPQRHHHRALFRRLPLGPAAHHAPGLRDAPLLVEQLPCPAQAPRVEVSSPCHRRTGVAAKPAALVEVARRGGGEGDDVAELGHQGRIHLVRRKVREPRFAPEPDGTLLRQRQSRGVRASNLHNSLGHGEL
mmetsp:Transcript_22600/g.64129  ORF Transcript_22600/g.64129 Transcript_22600/m.64129 type:complete len:225 (-) Transcript_22600:340-1014(-)